MGPYLFYFIMDLGATTGRMKCLHFHAVTSSRKVTYTPKSPMTSSYPSGQKLLLALIHQEERLPENVYVVHSSEFLYQPVTSRYIKAPTFSMEISNDA